MASHCTVPFWSRHREKPDVKQWLMKDKASDASLKLADITLISTEFY